MGLYNSSTGSQVMPSLEIARKYTKLLGEGADGRYTRKYRAEAYRKLHRTDRYDKTVIRSFSGRLRHSIFSKNETVISYE